MDGHPNDRVGGHEGGHDRVNANDHVHGSAHVLHADDRVYVDDRTVREHEYVQQLRFEFPDCEAVFSFGRHYTGGKKAPAR